MKTIAVSPASVCLGGVVRVNGTGYPSNTNLQLQIHGGSIEHGRWQETFHQDLGGAITSDGAGNWSLEAVLPPVVKHLVPWVNIPDLPDGPQYGPYDPIYPQNLVGSPPALLYEDVAMTSGKWRVESYYEEIPLDILFAWWALRSAAGECMQRTGRHGCRPVHAGLSVVVMNLELSQYHFGTSPGSLWRV